MCAESVLLKLWQLGVVLKACCLNLGNAFLGNLSTFEVFMNFLISLFKKFQMATPTVYNEFH
jgi:hypothetical protein